MNYKRIIGSLIGGAIPATAAAVLATRAWGPTALALAAGIPSAFLIFKNWGKIPGVK